MEVNERKQLRAMFDWMRELSNNTQAHLIENPENQSYQEQEGVLANVMMRLRDTFPFVVLPRPPRRKARSEMMLKPFDQWDNWMQDKLNGLEVEIRLAQTREEHHPIVYYPMTERQRRMALDLSYCTFPVGSNQKRFAFQMNAIASSDSESQIISEKQSAYLALLHWQYRRQVIKLFAHADIIDPRQMSTLPTPAESEE